MTAPLLLDTRVLLWWLTDDRRLAWTTRNRIARPSEAVFVSVATAWEISSLARRGVVNFGAPVADWLPHAVAVHRFAIVDKNTHPHPAIGCTQHSAGQQPPRFVPAKNEILKIDCSLCGIDHLHAGQESIGAYRNDAKSGVTVMFVRRMFKLLAKPGLLRMR